MSDNPFSYQIDDTTVPDLFKGFREEQALVQTKKKEREANAFKLAQLVEVADQSTMFGGDYSEAQQYAQWLTDNIDDFTRSSEGMIQFAQMANQLSSFIDSSEAYKTQNFGTASGGAQAGTFQGRILREQSGENPYGDFIDSRTRQSYEDAYTSLDQGRQLQYNEQGIPMLSARGRVDNPFMPQLVDNLSILSGYEYYDSKSEAFKDDHISADAAMNWTRRQIMSDPKMQRRVANLYLAAIKAEDESRAQMDLDELMTNPQLVQRAIDAYVTDAGNAWQDRFGEVVVSRAEEIFSGGVTGQGSPDFIEGQTELTTAEDISAAVGDEAGNLLLALEGQGLENNVENTGFNALLNLTEPITDDFTTELLEEEQITALNVDQLGNFYIEIETLSPVIPEGEEEIPGFDYPEEVSRSVRRVSASSDPGLHASLLNYVGSDLYSQMINQSEASAISSRRSRIKQRFEAAKARPQQEADQRDQEERREAERVEQQETQRIEELAAFLPENRSQNQGFGYLSDASSLNIDDLPEEVRNSPYFEQRLRDLGYREPEVNPSQGALGALGRGIRSGVASVVDFLTPGDYQTAESRQKDIIRQAAEETIRYLLNPEGMSPGMADMQAQDEVSRPSNEPTRDELRARLTEEQRAAYDAGGGVAILTNNPGNLRPFEGYDGPVYINPKDNSPFRVFDTPQEGLDALEKDLKIKREGRGEVGKKIAAGTLPSSAKTPDEVTMYDIISVYAPFIENDPVAYARSIADFAKSMGYPEISPSTPANQVPLKLLMQAIIKVESGQNYNILSNAGLLPLSSDLALN